MSLDTRQNQHGFKNPQIFFALYYFAAQSSRTFAQFIGSKDALKHQQRGAFLPHTATFPHVDVRLASVHRYRVVTLSPLLPVQQK
jgi:hypothetical protein